MWPARVSTCLSICNIETTVRLLPSMISNEQWPMGRSVIGKPRTREPDIGLPGLGLGWACWTEVEGADPQWLWQGCCFRRFRGCSPCVRQGGSILPLPQGEALQGPLTSSCDCSAGALPPDCVSSGLHLASWNLAFPICDLGGLSVTPAGMKRECHAAVSAFR